MKIYYVSADGDVYYVRAESAKHARIRVYGNDSLTDDSGRRIETYRTSKKKALEHKRLTKGYGVHVRF